MRERAVRLVLKQQREHGSQSASILSASAKIGCAAQSLHRWVARTERDLGQRAGLTSAERDRLKDRECANREIKRSNEILGKASAYFAQAELDRRGKRWWRTSMHTVASMGSSRSVLSRQSPHRRTSRARRGRRILGAFRPVPGVTVSSSPISPGYGTRTSAHTELARRGSS